MWGFLLGGAIGFALGSRAGRERYDRAVRASGRVVRQVLDHPVVQGAAGVASAKITALSGRSRPSSRKRRHSGGHRGARTTRMRRR